MTEGKIRYRKALQTDMKYLLWLREVTMTEHLLNSKIEINKKNHLERINYEYENAKIILFNEQTIGLLKTREYQNKLEIIQIQIEPIHQKKGFGQKIINAIIEESTKKKLKATLSVLKESKAQELYKRLGFKVFEENDSSFIMEYITEHNQNLAP